MLLLPWLQKQNAANSRLKVVINQSRFIEVLPTVIMLDHFLNIWECDFGGNVVAAVVQTPDFVMFHNV